MTVRLNDQDRARVRHHLGYLQTEPTSTIHLGVPAMSQALFLVERAMDNILPAAVALIQRALDVLDSIECKMVEAQCRLAAQSVAEVKMRNSNEEPTEIDLLEREYLRWSARLADDLGVPLNSFSHRFRSAAHAINVPVALPFV